jgi:integrase
MSVPNLINSVSVVDSTQAISALAKERIRMQAQQRYQRGSLTIMKRKGQPDVWSFRYYTEVNGRNVYKRKIIGTVVEFPKRKDAEKALTGLRVDINEGAAFAPMTVEQLAAHYLGNEAPDKAFSTREGYKNIIKNQVIPKWGESSLSSIVPIDVENWLKALKRRDGKPTSPGSKSKIRNVMSAMFSHAIRYGWAVQNPIKTVRTSSQRLKDPVILTPEEFRHLVGALDHRERVIVMLAGSTALRRSELFGLRWEDIDFEQLVLRVTHSIVRNVEGETKTPASHKPVPLPAIVAEELKRWRAVSPYRSEKDFLFPSIQKNGVHPIAPDMILRRHVRPALKKLGIEKHIGWHSFRHGMSNLLRECKVDIKVAQEMLRHANPRITMGIYQQTVTDERRAAQDLAFGTMMGTNTDISAESSNRTHANPRRPRKEEVKQLIN